jgi:formyltetrahydrofolate synthetase
MISGLLSTVPMAYRYVAVAIAFAATFATGFVKGLNYEQNKIKGEQAKALAKELSDAADLNKKLSDQLFESQAKQKQLDERNKQLSSRLAQAVGKSPTYVSKECEITDEVKDSLNEKIKNNWRNAK